MLTVILFILPSGKCVRYILYLDKFIVKNNNNKEWHTERLTQFDTLTAAWNDKFFNVLWFSVEANQTTPSIFYSQDYRTLFTPKNTLVIVTEILLCIFNIPINVYCIICMYVYIYKIHNIVYWLTATVLPEGNTFLTHKEVIIPKWIPLR